MPKLEMFAHRARPSWHAWATRSPREGPGDARKPTPPLHSRAFARLDECDFLHLMRD
jgi:hypothetical protein